MTLLLMSALPFPAWSVCTKNHSGIKSPTRGQRPPKGKRINPQTLHHMTRRELYSALSDEQKRLHDYLEENGRSVFLFKQDGEICAEVEDWTDRGVNMIITLMPFSFDELQSYYDGFDIDEEIDLHRQDERYRKAFRISHSVSDFENWGTALERLICNYNGKVA